MTSPSPVLADPIQIPVLRGQPPTQICPRVGGSVLIYNPDLTNVVNVGYKNNIGSSNSLPVQPLGSATLDGSRSVYAFLPQSASVGSVLLCVAPGGTNISPSPAQISAQINALGLARETTQQLVEGNTGATVAGLGTVNGTLGSPAQDGTVNGLNSGVPNGIAATGAPLLALANTFANPGGQTFAPGQVRTYGGPTPFGQISYEIFLFFSSNAAETNPGFVVELNWFNSVSGQVISTERWFMCGAAAPVGNSYVGTGRAKGDSLQMSVTYNGTLTSGTCQVVIMKTSRVYIRDDFRSTFFGGFPGVPNGGYDLDANVVMETAPTVGAGNQVQRSMSLYSGTVRLTGFTQTGSANVGIFTQDTTFSNNTVFQANIGANNFINPQFDLPRKQCFMVITNTGSGSQQIPAAVYVSEQNV